jgi:hypothetical protein
MDHPAAFASVLLAASVAAGCGTIGSIKSVNLVLATEPCEAGFCGARIGIPLSYRVGGLESCSVARLHFGDGNVAEGRNINFGSTGAAQWEVGHTYTGWPGPKTVTAEGVTSCVGTVRQRVQVLLPTGNPARPLAGDVRIGYMPSTTACNVLANFPPLRAGTRVAVTGNPSPAVVVDFGCPFAGCIYGIGGKPQSIAGSRFPFPGLREFSLVLRIGTQVEQGGFNVSFVANQTAPLELCMNDDLLTDNSGAWGVFLTVDESTAP